MNTEQTYQHEGRDYLTWEYYQYLVSNDLIVDCSAGGLVEGPSMRGGGIQMIQLTKDARVFLDKKIEGWQFVVNDFAASDNSKEIKAMCPLSMLGDAFFLPYVIPDGIDIIQVTPKEVGGAMVTPYLVYGAKTMLTTKKEAARKNLYRFNEMNRAAWQTHMIEAKPKPTISETAKLARWTLPNNN